MALPALSLSTVGATISQPIVILPALIIAVAYIKSRRDSSSPKGGSNFSGGEMNPAQHAHYVQTLKLKDPVSMLAMADAFEQDGFRDAATMIRKRARLKQLPEEVKAERERIFRQLMASTNKNEIVEMAKTYAEEGCTDAAKALLTHAESLP